MKLLFISSPPFADCDFPLIRTLQEAGHDVTCLIYLTPYYLKSTLFNIKKQINKNSIITAQCYPELKVYEKYMDLNKTFIINQTSNQDSSFSTFNLVLKVIKFIHKGHFDIIHTGNIFNMWYMSLYYLFRNKMVLTVHDPFPHSGEINNRKLFNYKMAMRIVKYFVLLNQNQKHEFCQKYKLNSKQILINHLGIYDNIQTFTQTHINPNPYNVLFFGRISPYKGIEYLCQAMVEVRKHIPNASLTIAGGGKMYFDIEPYKKYDWINIQNRYIEMQELALLLQKCSISVCPYIDATQSGVIMTSYSMCKPVIATNVGGLSEMVDDGKSGILIPPKDVQALANAIINLLNNNELYLNMQQYIKRQYFTGEKSWESIANTYIKFYSRCLKH
jgi:glycosyltransferase involved in cell wall biosynthesis